MEFGKVEYRCSCQRNGKASARTLHLTLIGLEDQDLLARKGVRALRLNRILRLTAEALDQGCPLSYEDLSALLLTSLATLKRDVFHIERSGRVLPIRGRRRKSPSTDETACAAQGSGASR